MTPEEHHKEAERLMARGKSLLASSHNPDAAGSSIRKQWAEDARDMLTEAAVHAAFPLAAPSAEDTRQARVAYLALLKSDFYRIWPHGQPRSMEYEENWSFRNKRDAIADLEAKIKEELL